MHALYIAVAPLVLNLTSKYFPLCAGKITDPEDLIQCGYFAVWRAARAFNPARGCRFTTTLQYHVQNVCWEQLGFRRKQLETVSLSTPIDNDEDLTIEDMIEDPKANIYDYIELNECKRSSGSGKQPTSSPEIHNLPLLLWRGDNRVNSI